MAKTKWAPLPDDVWRKLKDREEEMRSRLDRFQDKVLVGKRRAKARKWVMDELLNTKVPSYAEAQQGVLSRKVAEVAVETLRDRELFNEWWLGLDDGTRDEILGEVTEQIEEWI